MTTWRDRWRQLVAHWSGNRGEETRQTMTNNDDDDVRPDPFEPAEGQETEPPDLLLASIAAIHLLRDIRGRLERQHTDDPADAEAAEYLLRIGAVVAVLRRVRDRLEDGET